jgi:hypothetical protein
MDHVAKKKRPTGLDDLAAIAAAEHGDKGGVVITLGAGGVHIGASGLTPDELRKALCTAIHYTYVHENAYDFEVDMDPTSALKAHRTPTAS